MILTGNEIKKRLGSDIIIDPFDEKRLNPNSYNLTLSHEIGFYKENELDMKKDNVYFETEILESGFILYPDTLYLCRTRERTITHNLVPMIEGRSSIGRLGIFIHSTAGFGDVGFDGFWTLELSVVQPVRIYAGVEICQIFYHEVTGEITEYNSGKYQGNTGIQPSKIWKEF